MDERLREVQDQLKDVLRTMKGKEPLTVEDLVRRTKLPFSVQVMNCSLPHKFRTPRMEAFEGTKDPLDHLETYRMLMHLQTLPDEIMCRDFPFTLKGPSRAWFRKLKPGSINSFLDLSKRFVSHFISARSCRKPVTYLLNIKQERDESLRNYITQFNKEAVQVDDTDDMVILTALMGGF